jgi:quercetin dioxygenase-like cupin family protein
MHPGRTPFLWGMLAGASLMALALAGPAAGSVVAACAIGRVGAQGAASPPVATDSARKVVLENARVRVKDVTFAPGASPMHTHELAHVGVILTAGTLVFTEPGQPAESVKFDAGSVGFREAHVTHQVTNPGRAPMRVIEVELK